MDWWQAYQDEGSSGEQPSISELLESALERADSGLRKVQELEESFTKLLQDGLLEAADLLLDGMRAGQEDFEGEESVFPPLVAVHGRIKRLNGWATYREELAKFIKDLEDLLGSPKVRSAAANRLRYPDPNGVRSPSTSEQRSPTGKVPDAQSSERTSNPPQIPVNKGGPGKRESESTLGKTTKNSVDEPRTVELFKMIYVAANCAGAQGYGQGTTGDIGNSVLLHVLGLLSVLAKADGRVEERELDVFDEIFRDSGKELSYEEIGTYVNAFSK